MQLEAFVRRNRDLPWQAPRDRHDIVLHLRQNRSRGRTVSISFRPPGRARNPKISELRDSTSESIAGLYARTMPMPTTPELKCRMIHRMWHRPPACCEPASRRFHIMNYSSCPLRFQQSLRQIPGCPFRRQRNHDSRPRPPHDKTLNPIRSSLARRLGYRGRSANRHS